MPGLKINNMLFPNGKRKALTLSYDDGVYQDKRLILLMENYGIKGTFNLNSGLMGRGDQLKVRGKMTDVSTISPSEVPEVYRNFEVATHGVTHMALTGMGIGAMNEIFEDRKALEKLTGRFVRGHAYPFGVYDDTVISLLQAAGICYARTVDSTGTFELPKDFMKWNPTCHHTDTRLMELAHRFCEQEERYGRPQLFYLWGHAYEFDADQNWDVIETFLQYMAQHGEDIWMAANLEIVDYVNAYRSLIFSADGQKVFNPSAYPVWMERSGHTYCISPAEWVDIGS